MGNDQKKLSGSNSEADKSSSTYHPDILVVSEKKPDSLKSSSQSDLNKLRHVPLFYPILKSTIGMSDDQKLLQISPEHLIKLASLLQNHLNTCAFNVTKDQEAVIAEIKNLENVIDLLMQNFTEKQRKYAKYCEQFKNILDMSQSLRKIQRSMDEILPTIKQINDLLPAEDRLEEFTF